MILQDKIKPVGQFMIKSYKADGSVEILDEKNLIMESARTNMASLIGGSTEFGGVINKFVLGTKGHVGTDLLDNKQVGEEGFESSRTELFSEEDSTAYSYAVEFDPIGLDDISVDASGTMYLDDTAVYTNSTVNTVKRVISDRTVTYTFEIPATNGNSAESDSVIAYTEAALYASEYIFSMKCFSARVKEDSVRLEIIWSIIF